MFAPLARFSLQSQIRKDNLIRKKQFLPWEKVEKIALILQQHESINKSAVDRFMDSTNKFVEVFYIDLKAKAPAYADWRCFSKKDASLLALPRQTILRELKNKTFDLVIATPGNSPLFTAALVSGLKAPFKCGFSQAFNNVDLIIEKPGAYQLMSYLDDALRYLKMIKM